MKKFECHQVPTWISHRSYDIDGEQRTLISNHRTLESFCLEDESSIAWRLLLGEQPGTLDRDLFSAENLEEFAEMLATHHVLDTCDPLTSSSDFASDEDTPYQDSVEHEADNLERSAELRVSDWLDQKGMLSTGFIEVTYGCNEKCLHCFNPGATHEVGGKHTRDSSGLPLESLLNIIDELYDQGVYGMVVSGGEFFTYKYWYEALEKLHSLRLRTTLFTNGINLKDRHFDALAKFHPYEVDISIYSIHAHKHDEFTQVPGAWQMSVDTIRRLVELGIRVKIKTPLMQDTAFEYRDLRMLADELGAEISFDTLISAANDGAKQPLNFNVSDFNQLVHLSLEADSPWYVGTATAPQKRTIDRKKNAPCGIGKSTIAVSAQGKILPCVALPKELGDATKPGEIERVVKHKGDTAGSEDTLGYWRAFTYADSQECGTHDRCAFCFRCIGGSYVDSGTHLTPSANQCFQADARLFTHNLVVEGLSAEEIKNLYPVKSRLEESLIPAIQVT